jgi:hypothetical protein
VRGDTGFDAPANTKDEKIRAARFAPREFTRVKARRYFF